MKIEKPKVRHTLTTLYTLLLTLLLLSCGQKTAPVELKSEVDVAGKTIGVPTGSYYDIEMTKRQDIRLERYTTLSDLIAVLKTGKIDAFLTDEISMSPGDMKRQGVKISFRSDETFDIAYAFALDDEATPEDFNRFLSEARQSGLYEQMRHRWFDTQDPDTVRMPAIAPGTGGRPLHVACSYMVAPMCFLEGSEWKGFEVEILERYAAQAGRPIDFKIYEVAAGPASLQSHKSDVWVGSLFITEERAKSVRFSDPYYACHPAYFIIDSDADPEVGPWDKLKEAVHKNLIVEDRWRFITDGLLETVIISIFSLLLGTLLAMLVCWMRMSRYRLMRSLAVIYINVMRGIPLLVLLMIMFYVVLASSGLSATVVAIISFSMVFAAYASEMFRTAILSVGKGQTEAGIALGFTRWQTFRHIILPQAARAVMPVYKGEAVSLFKNTSIVGYIAIQDLTKASDLIRSRTFDAFFPLITITIIYFLLAWLLGKALDRAVKTPKA